MKLSARVLAAMLTIAPVAVAQSLPPEARMQVLIAQANDAIARQDNGGALALFGEMATLKTVKRPPDTYIVEAKVAGQLKDYPRAQLALLEYFRSVDSRHAAYEEAAQIYAALEGMMSPEEKGVVAAAEAERKRLEAQREAELAKAAAAAAARAAPRAQFFEHGSFRGFSFTIRESNPNFGAPGLMNDQASSARLVGRWLLCSDGYYGGRCMEATGDISDLGTLRLNDALSSARYLGPS